MSLSREEKVAILRMAHAMVDADGDHEFTATHIIRQAQSATRSTLLTTLMSDELTEEEQIAALDALPTGVQDAAVIRWGS